MELISKDGTKIAYEVYGEGPPVILVDGAMCYRDFGPMRPLASQLSKQFAVYTYDRRGRGASGDTQPYAIAREIEDIEALIAEAGGTAFVFGISSGAVLALKAASELGGKMIKLAIYEPPLTLGDEARERSVTYTRQLDERLSADQRGAAVELFMNYVGTPQEAVAAMRHSPMWQTWEALAPTLAYDNAIMGDSQALLDEAKAVHTAALVLDGGHSPAFMHKAADELAFHLPGVIRWKVKPTMWLRMRSLRFWPNTL